MFGSVCYAYVENKGKLDAQCQEGLFLGYDKESPAYLVHVLSPVNFVKKVRCVLSTLIDCHMNWVILRSL